MDWQCPIFEELCAAEYYGCGWLSQRQLEGGGTFLSCFLGFPDDGQIEQYQILSRDKKQKIREIAKQERKKDANSA